MLQNIEFTNPIRHVRDRILRYSAVHACQVSIGRSTSLPCLRLSSNG